MKIQLLSDLHIEFATYKYPEAESDVVVLAGDIHTKNDGVKWALENITDKPVVYVFGNHEFYKSTYPKLIDTAKEMAEGTNVHILENEVLVIDDVNFLGCTLWTDFEMFGDPRIAGYHCQQTMNDYQKIKRLPNFSKMRAIDTGQIHRQSKAWLAKELDARKHERNIVVTHHGPSLKSVAAEFHNDLTTAAYASKLDSFIKKHSPTLWLHGHMHNSSDYLIDDCRILCNPKGYCGYENPEFKPFAIFEI